MCIALIRLRQLRIRLECWWILWSLNLASEVFHDFVVYKHDGERHVSSCAVFEKKRGCNWKRVGILETRRPRLSLAEFLKKRSRD